VWNPNATHKKKEFSAVLMQSDNFCTTLYHVSGILCFRMWYPRVLTPQYDGHILSLKFLFCFYGDKLAVTLFSYCKGAVLFYQAVNGLPLSTEAGFDSRPFHLPTETDIPERTLSLFFQHISTNSFHLLQTLYYFNP